MFAAFLVQIVFRYFFSFPVGWTSELTVATWLWLVLWGSAFVLKEKEEIRFDLVYPAVGRRARRVMGDPGGGRARGALRHVVPRHVELRDVHEGRALFVPARAS